MPFLAEHELPDKAKQDGTEQLAEDMEKAAAQGISPVATTRNDASAGPSSFPGTGSALGGAGPSTSAPAGATARGQAPTSRAPASGGGLNSQAEQDIQTVCESWSTSRGKADNTLADGPRRRAATGYSVTGVRRRQCGYRCFYAFRWWCPVAIA